MNKIVREKQFLNFSNYKKIYAFLIDWLIFFLVTLAILFGIATPVLNNNSQYVSLQSQQETNYQSIQEIGTESKLILINEDSGTNYTFDMIYKLYVTEHILLSYEYSPENLDDIEFSTDIVPTTIKAASYDTNFLAYFYTSYMVDKTDDNGTAIIDTEDYKEYYLNNVLDVSNNDWWVVGTDGELPHLNDDAARYLTESVLLERSYSTSSNTSTEFKAYFNTMYNQAGSKLLKVPEYKTAYTNYNTSYDAINDMKTNVALISSLIVFVSLFVLIPLLFGYYQTLGYRLFHLGTVDSLNRLTYYQFILNVLGRIISSFFVCGLVGLIFVGSSFFGIEIFPIASTTVTLGILTGVSLIIDIISLISVLLSVNAKGVSNLISLTHDSEII